MQILNRPKNTVMWKDKHHCNRLFTKAERLKERQGERERDGDLEVTIVWVHFRSQRREIRQSDTCQYALH